ncbi:hypothetical protein KAJ27_15160 [bacterium]|nr:hypothetical protein [bacterium]
MKRKKIPYGTKMSVTITIRERDLIRDKTLYDPNFANVAVTSGDKIKVDLSLDDIDDLIGYIAAGANHAKNKKLQKELDKLFTKLQKILDKYDDQDE